MAYKIKSGRKPKDEKYRLVSKLEGLKGFHLDKEKSTKKKMVFYKK